MFDSRLQMNVYNRDGKTRTVDFLEIKTVGQLREAVFKAYLGERYKQEHYEKMRQDMMVVMARSTTVKNRLFSKDISDDTVITDDEKNTMAGKTWEIKPYFTPISALDEVYILTVDKTFYEKAKQTTTMTSALKLLGDDLEGKYSQESKCLLLISIGSYVNEGLEPSCRKQQYPSWIENNKHHFNKIHIILVDTGFNQENGRQIYDYIKSFKLNKRQLDSNNECIYKKYVDEKNKIYLHIYPTQVDVNEYAGTARTIAGKNLDKIGEDLSRRGSVFVSGNLFGELVHYNSGINNHEIKDDFKKYNELEAELKNKPKAPTTSHITTADPRTYQNIFSVFTVKEEGSENTTQKDEGVKPNNSNLDSSKGKQKL